MQNPQNVRTLKFVSGYVAARIYGINYVQEHCMRDNFGGTWVPQAIDAYSPLFPKNS